MSSKDYNDMLSYLDAFDKDSSDVLSMFKNASDFYGEYATEQDYNDFVESTKEWEKMANEDISALERDIEETKNRQYTLDDPEVKARILAAQTAAGSRKKEWWESDVRNENDMPVVNPDFILAEMKPGEVTSKQEYLDQVKAVQEVEKAKQMRETDPDFSQYAAIGKALPGNEITFSRNNDQLLQQMSAAEGTYDDVTLYKEITEDEYDTYSYLLAKEKEGAVPAGTAQSFYDTIKGYLVNRQAEKRLNEIKGDWVTEQLFGIKAGLNQYFTGALRSLDAIAGKDYFINPNTTEVLSSLVREDLGTRGPSIFGRNLNQGLYDLTVTNANMLPSIAMSMATGYLLGGAGGVIGANASKIGEVLGSTAMGLSAGGHAYADALNNGFTVDQARGYAVLTGASETLLQELMGGLPGLNGVLTGKAIESFSKGVNNAFARAALQLGAKMYGEGMEEFLQDVLEPYFKAFMTGTAPEKVDWGEAIYSGVMGALSSLVGSGGEVVVNGVTNAAANRALVKGFRGDQTELALEMLKSDDQDVRNRGTYFQSRIEKGKNLSGSQLREAVLSTDRDKISTAVKNELTRRGNETDSIGAVDSIRRAETRDAYALADLITKEYLGEELTRSERNELKNNKAAQEILADMSDERIFSESDRSQWARDIGTRMVGDWRLNLTERRRDAVKQGIEEESKRRLDLSENKEYNVADETTKKEEVAAKFVEKTVEENGKTVTKKELANKSGEVLAEDTATYESDDVAILYDYLKNSDMDAQTANNILQLYKEAPGVGAATYLVGAEEAMLYGKANYDMSKAKTGDMFDALPENLQKRLYELGQESAKKQFAAEQADIEAYAKNHPDDVKKLNGSEVISLYDRSKLDARRRTGVDAIEKIVSKITGNRIVLFESVKNENNEYVATQTFGMIKEGQEVNQGIYDLNTGTIYLDINAGRNSAGTVLYTAAHELTHFIRQWSPEKFKVLSDFLMQEYGKAGADINDLIYNKMERAKAAGSPISRDVAWEEVVADSMEPMFTDANALEKMMKLKEQDRTLWAKMKSWINRLLSRIRGTYAEMNPDSYEGRTVKGMVDALEKLSDLFAEAAVEAGNTFTALTARAADGYAIAADQMTNEQAFTNSAAAVMNQIRTPYTEGTNAWREFVDNLPPEAKEVHDMFYNFFTLSKITNAKNLAGDKTIAKINISSVFVTAQEWNDKISKDQKWKECAMKLAASLPEKVRKEMNFNLDGTLTPVPLEVRFKMQKSLAQRLVDSLGYEKIDSEYELYGKKIKLKTAGATQSVGGEAYRRALIAETRKLYAEGKLRKVDIGTMSKDRWGSLGFLAANGKTGASGDLTTICPQMMFNLGCQYCYRRAALETGVNNKLVAQSVWYTGEILRIKDDDVRALNENGGLRIQSFGDWMPHFSAELADIIADAEVRGLQVKIITKEPSMIEYVASLREQGLGLNLYFNLSADYAIEKGPENIDNFGNESLAKVNQNRPFMRDENNQFWWKRAMTVEEAYEWRKKYPWVNVRIVATTREEFIRGLKDPKVQVVTGYHGHIREWERIDSTTGQKVLQVEPLGDAGMPRFAYVNGAWIREFDGKTKTHQALADEIEKNNLQQEYYIKTCCITGRCATCQGKCGKLASSFYVKNATNDAAGTAYWYDHMSNVEMELTDDIEVPSEIATASVKYSVRLGMTDEERYNELKDSVVYAPVSNVKEEDLGTIKTLEEAEDIAVSKATKVIVPLAEKLGIIGKPLRARNLETEFIFSKTGGLRESIHRQQFYGGTYADFAKALVNLDRILQGAELIEQHEDKYKGTERENEALANVSVLFGMFKDGEYLIPTLAEIKHYKNDDVGRLYMTVAMTKIKEADVVVSVEGDSLLQILLSASKYKLSDVIANVNSEDGRFLKYLPDQMLNDEQMSAKEKALAEDAKKIENLPKKDSGIRNSLRLVDPIDGDNRKNGLWKPGFTTEEAMEVFPDLWNVAADSSDTKNPTSVKITEKSYRKIYDLLKEEGFKGTIMDASSGLGYGTELGIDEYGFDVEDIEPYPGERHEPTSRDYSTWDKTYDVVISNAVLNVLPQEQRDAMVAKIGEMLNPGGRAFINVRSASDVRTAKSKLALDEGNAEYVITNTGSYQKGFRDGTKADPDRSELVAYLRDGLGDGYTVERADFGNGVWAIVTKNGNAGNIRYSNRYYFTDEDYLKAVKANPLVNAVMETIKDADSMFSSRRLDDLYAAHPEYDFIERLQNKDKNAEADLAKLLESIDNADALQDLRWYVVEGHHDIKEKYTSQWGDELFRFVSYKKTHTRGIKRFREIIDARRDQLASVGGTDFGFKQNQHLSFEEVEKFFWDHNDNKDLVDLAKKVFNVAKNLDLAFVITNTGYDASTGATSMGGYYNGNRSLETGKSGLVALNRTYMNGTRFADSSKAQTILHELIHAVTMHDVFHSSNMLIDQKYLRANEAFSNLYRKIKYRDISRAKNVYGLSNEAEFVAELANPEFREFLRTSSVPLDDYVNLLMDQGNLFGIEADSRADVIALKALDSVLDDFDYDLYNDMSNRRVYQKVNVRYSDRAELGTLFTGGGTFESALNGLIHTQYAAENRPPIVSAYQANHGGYVYQDVLDIDPKELQKVQYLHVSPPCVNFSNMRNGQGERPIDKALARKIADIILEQKPRAVTVENVQGYATSESMNMIREALRQAGYKSVDIGIYKDSDYGGYTNRECVILRAMRDEDLPPIAEKATKKSGWLDAVGMDFLEDLPDSTSVNPRMIASLKANNGIDPYKVKKPLLVFGESYKNGQFGHAYGDQVLPTIIAESGASKVFLPGGIVKECTPEVLFKIMGLEGYNIPKQKTLARRIVGNGIPAAITNAVMRPIVDNIGADNAERDARGESIRYQLREDAGNEVRRVLRNIHAREDVILTDNTPNIMLEHGAKNYPMVMTPRHVRMNIMTEEQARNRGITIHENDHYHGLGINKFLKVISELDDINLAYRGTKKALDATRRENLFLLVSDEKDVNGDRIIVPIFCDRKAQVNRVFTDMNQIATIYGKEEYEKYIRKQLEGGQLVRIKKRSTKASERTGLIPGGYSESASGINLSQPNSESQEVSGENLRSQLRPTDVSERVLLANALEGAAITEGEKKLIEDYQKTAFALDSDRRDITEIRREIAEELGKPEAEQDKKRISELRQKANALKNNIETRDKKLLRITAMKPIKELLQTERKRYDELEAARRADRRTYQQEYAARIERNYYKPRIQKLVKDLTKLMDNKDKNHPIPEAFAGVISNVLKNIDMITYREGDSFLMVRDGKANEERMGLRQALTKLADQLSDLSIEKEYGQLDLAPDMLDWIRETREALDARFGTDDVYQINRMNGEELQNLYKILRSLKTSVQNAGRMYTQMSMSIGDLGEKTIEHLMPLTETEKSRIAESGIGRMMLWDFAQPATVFARFGESGQTLLTGLMGGQRKEAQNIQKILDFVEDAYTEEEAKTWSDTMLELEIGDQKVSVPVTYVMELYATSRDADGFRHIAEGGGVKFADVNTSLLTKQTFNNKFMTRDELFNAISKLTDRQKQVAEKMQEFMDDQGAEWGNAVSMRRFGYKAFGQNGTYYPLTTIKNGSEYEAAQKRANIFALLNKSFTKERVKGANNALVINDIFKTFSNHMSEMAIYNAWAFPVLDTIKWLNFRIPADFEAGTNEVSLMKTMENALGKEADAYVRRLLEAVNSQKSGGLSEDTPFRVLRMMNRVAVAGNIRVAVQQPFSVVRAFEIVDPKYFKVLLGKKKQEAYNEMVENSSFGLWKSMGYYDVDVSRPLEREILKDTSFADKVTEKSMRLAEMGDELTWANIWAACKAEAKAKNPSISEADLIEKTRTRFDQVIVESQVVDSVLTKSQWMRSDKFFHRATSAFMSEPMTTYNMLLRKWDAYSRDVKTMNRQEALKRNGKAIGKAVVIFALAQLVNALATAPIDAMRDDDDYETFWEKFADAFNRSFSQNILPTSLMPYISDIVDYMRYGSSDRSDIAIPVKMWDLGKQIYSTINGYSVQKLHKTFKQSVEAISTLTGLPISNPMRDAISIWNTVVAPINQGTLKFQTAADSNSVAYKKLYQFLAEGSDRAEDIFAQMQSNMVNMDSAYSDLNRLAKEDYLSGKLSRSEAMERLRIIAEYFDKKSDYNTLLKKIENWEKKK